MQQLQLYYDQELQGKFTLGTLNFLFTFQVNCPGCFLYGIPLVNRLYHEFGKEVSFLGLSTAFEDFEYNSTTNTSLLLTKKEVVGETKKALEAQGIASYEDPIDFPIAMDTKADDAFDIESAAAQICILNPNYNLWTAFEQKALQDKVIQYLKEQKTLSLTFILNQMRGTPTMIVFNEDY